MSDPAVYRYIPEGRGGYFMFRDTPTERDKRDGYKDVQLLPHIGTYGCSTCVGVYFAISNEAAFTAHINSSKQIPGHGAERFVTDEEGEVLKTMVISQLQANTDAHGWGPASIVKESMIMVCPYPEGCLNGSPSRTKSKRVGAWVIDAFQQFLSLTDDEAYASEAQGFVVRHNGKDRENVRFVSYREQDICRDKPPPEELAGYDGRKESATDDWSFAVRHLG